MSFIRVLILLAAALLVGGWDAYAQERSFTIALRGAPLDEAIERFVDATGAAVSYEPSLVRGRTTSCAAREEPAEDILRCILRETGIDFHRLSSGTYVLTEAVEIAPEYGFVAGRVIDAETGSPLAGAHVQLADVGAVTDGAGRFSFPALLPGSYRLLIRHVGYASWHDSLHVRPQEQIVAEASLSSETVFITPVIIDGYSSRTPRQQLEVTQVRGADPPVGYAESNVGAYRHVRGLAGVRLNDVTADAHIQGSDAGAHQLRLDGVPVFLPRSLAGLIGPFSSFGLERIRVHRAGFGAVEGSHLGGVLAAEQALAATSDFDLQADPYSINGRVRLASSSGVSPRVSAMVAGRRGLWDVMIPSRLQSMLEGWSRPDPFALFAPLEGPENPYALPETPEFLQGPINPSLRFSDLHAAGRLAFGPLRSLHASYYQGRQELSGGLLSHRGLLRAGDNYSVLAVVDDYNWSNRLGQIRYDAVLGSRTLANLQARVSRYDLDHSYETLDSLDVILQDSTLRLTEVSFSPVRDGNKVSLYAIEGELDHAFDRHHLQLGFETGLIRSRFDLRSVHFTAAGYANDNVSEMVGREGAGGFQTHQLGVDNLSDGWYAAVFGEDRLRVSGRMHVEAGVRLTYLHARRTVYAEPRAALMYDGSDSPLGEWSGRTSAGLYRQFLNQTDASQLGVGLLLPSVRIWLPVDATVRPPIAYHLAQEFIFEPAEHWSLRFDGYVKFQPHGLTLAYAPANSQSVLSGSVPQSDFLAGTRGTTLGGSAGLAWRTSVVRAEAVYSREHATRKSQVLFGGRRHPVPWTEPHRLEISLDWMPLDRMALSGRWQAVWGRAWGFRQMYYDYFGHHQGTRFHGPFDLGDPASHRLPPLYQLDLSAAYTHPLGPANLQLRAEVLNVLGRENVMDWRLIRAGGEWQKEARTLYPMMPSLAARLHF